MPCSVVFGWRPNETVWRHRNPLFDASIGMKPEHILAVDVFHALVLGVMNTCCRVALCNLLLSNTYGQSDSTDEGFVVVVMAVRHALLELYKQRARAKPGEGLTCRRRYNQNGWHSNRPEMQDYRC